MVIGAKVVLSTKLDGQVPGFLAVSVYRISASWEHGDYINSKGKADTRQEIEGAEELERMGDHDGPCATPRNDVGAEQGRGSRDDKVATC